MQYKTEIIFYLFPIKIRLVQLPAKRNYILPLKNHFESSLRRSQKTSAFQNNISSLYTAINQNALKKHYQYKYKTILLQSSQMDLCFILFHFVPLYFIFMKTLDWQLKPEKESFLLNFLNGKKNLEWYNHKLMEKNLEMKFQGHSAENHSLCYFLR